MKYFTPAEAPVYVNRGNKAFVDFTKSFSGAVILDVGCGIGGNANLIKEFNPSAKIYGITLSQAEQVAASKNMEKCWIRDIETQTLDILKGYSFDMILFCHVLEHFRNPRECLLKFLPFLRPEGAIFVAVPNVLFWRQRWQFCLGKFDYTDGGTLDCRHLRFFTFPTVETQLFPQRGPLRVKKKEASGTVPLWILRRYIFPEKLSEKIDRLGSRAAPNLFGSQIFIEAMRGGA